MFDAIMYDIVIDAMLFGRLGRLADWGDLAAKAIMAARAIVAVKAICPKLRRRMS